VEIYSHEVGAQLLS